MYTNTGNKTKSPTRPDEVHQRTKHVGQVYPFVFIHIIFLQVEYISEICVCVCVYKIEVGRYEEVSYFS